MRLILKGIGASPGKVSGKTRVVSGIGDYSKFSEGEILVAKITDPSMTVMMNKAAGIICDIGGQMSHPSIVARELGIPCIVNAKIATKKLKDGMMIAMDGKTGEVHEVR
jgi:pyruvate,water dikinase